MLLNLTFIIVIDTGGRGRNGGQSIDLIRFCKFMRKICVKGNKRSRFSSVLFTIVIKDKLWHLNRKEGTHYAIQKWTDRYIRFR